MIIRCNCKNRVDCGCVLEPCVFNEKDINQSLSKSTICPVGEDDSYFIENTSSQEFLLLVAGTRSFEDYNFFRQKMDIALSKKSKNQVVIISGGEKGVDKMAERYAMENHISFIEFPADRTKGKCAGYERNSAMHKYLSNVPKDQRGCILFWDGISPGTKQNYELASKYDTVVKTVKI